MIKTSIYARLRIKTTQLYEKYFGHKQDYQKHINRGYDIAHKTLKDRYCERGILASVGHFADVWTRDSCFASFGSLAIGDTEIVKTNLKTLLKYMKPDGQLPLRVGSKSFLLKYFGFPGKIEGRYSEDKGVSVPVDNNSLFIISLHQYYMKTKDKNFMTRHFKEFQTIMDWNFSVDADGDLLIEEGSYAGWADSVKKNGKVLYTNVIHYRAIECFAELCEHLGKQTEADHYHVMSRAIKKRINEIFWNGHYYIDWINSKPRDYLSTDGNVLAILFEVADEEQGKKIQESMKKFRMNNTFSTSTNHPKYELKHIFPPFIPLCMADYHNGQDWLWIGCCDAVSKHMVGLKDEAVELLSNMAKKIDEYDGVFEVYFKGKPLKRPFYSSARNFAWSSGLYIWACQTIGLKE